MRGDVKHQRWTPKIQRTVEIDVLGGLGRDVNEIVTSKPCISLRRSESKEKEKETLDPRAPSIFNKRLMSWKDFFFRIRDLGNILKHSFASKTIKVLELLATPSVSNYKSFQEF